MCMYYDDYEMKLLPGEISSNQITCIHPANIFAEQHNAVEALQNQNWVYMLPTFALNLGLMIYYPR